MTSLVCTCGERHPHRIASRRSASGTIVELWSDGPITGALGIGLRHVPIVRPKTGAAMDAALRAGHLFLGEVELHDDDALGALYAACRWAAARDGLPGTVRKRLAHLDRPALRPSWQVLSADSRGVPTCRVWVLPRMRWPGLAVWHERGRYEVVSRVGGRHTDATYKSTGVVFRTMREVTTYLDSIDELSRGVA